MLNISKGNMYEWASHTWNPIHGRCPHACPYCYMRNKPVGDLRFDEHYLNDKLGEDRTIFIGSSCDMFALAVPSEWIHAVLKECRRHKNRYLFQTKNTERFAEFVGLFPKDTVFGTTLETNRSVTEAAPEQWRRAVFINMPQLAESAKMVSIEPIMDFDLGIFTSWLKHMKPNFVSIGADSQRSGLQEPPALKVQSLIVELNKFTEVKLKKNLRRLIE